MGALKRRYNRVRRRPRPKQRELDHGAPQPAASQPVAPVSAAPAPALSNQALQRSLRAGVVPPQLLLARHQALGNQAVQRLIQAKLTVTPAGDAYEHEADRVAAAVMSGPARPAAPAATAVQSVARAPLPEEGTGAVSPALEAQITGMQGGGQPLPAAERAFFEPRFGMDFGDVRLHADAQAGTAAQAVSARAFTVGRDIAFAPSQYEPGTSAGRELLAHELTHVVQQGGGQMAQPAAAVQRQEDGAGAGTDAPVGNPLVGLTRGDGLNVGTFERRPRVQLLQEKLNEKMLAGIKADGMFGPKTGQVLREFQASIGQTEQEAVDRLTGDALLDRKSGGDKPPEPVPPQPVFENRALEDTLDAVWLQYQFILTKQRDALDRLEKDLASLEKPPSTVRDLLIKAGSAALEAVLGAAGGSALRDPIKKALEGLEQEFINKGVDTVFDEAKSKSVTLAEEEAKTRLDEGLPPLDTFIESQRQALNDAGGDIQEKFLTETKPKFREFTAEDVPAAGADPRVERANKLLRGLKKERGKAFETQYFESLQEWASYEARTKLGKKENKGQSVGDEKVEGTDLSKDESGVAGVLELEIEGTAPNLPVQLKEAEISGLSEKTRKKLEERDASIGALNLARRAEGDVGSQVPIFDFGPSIEIAENETGEVFEVDSSAGGKEWLAQKARPFKTPDDPSTADDVLSGARMVWQEIDQKKLKDAGGLKKG